MDRMIYLAMTGVKHTFLQQAATAHNLANATTTAYKAEQNSFRALPVQGDGAKTRTFVVDNTTGADLSEGAIQRTGRDLDVALQGKGWLAVQAEDGSEAYTRNGSLAVGPNGQLQTRSGQLVVGDAGPITIPPDSQITVGRDGTISIIPNAGGLNAVAAVGRIKLVNPPESELVKGTDGLFRQKNGQAAPADANVHVLGGALENSNVNVVDTMISMISQARQFEMQWKLVQNADANAKQASQLLNLNA